MHINFKYCGEHLRPGGAQPMEGAFQDARKSTTLRTYVEASVGRCQRRTQDAEHFMTFS